MHIHTYKDFLNLFCLFEETSALFQEKGFFWCVRGNFLSLLNLPSQVHMFGKIHNHWEGSRERYIQAKQLFCVDTGTKSVYLKYYLMIQKESVSYINGILQ